MAELYETLFYIQLLITLAVVLAKLYNVISFSKFLDPVFSVILFIVSLIGYGTGLSIFLIEHTKLLLISLFKLQTGIFSLIFILQIVELLFLFNSKVETVIKSYNSRQVQANANKTGWRT